MLNRTIYALRELLGYDRAENSIMQTITIAVSAILIAAGLVTAPGLINNARDNNATTDLANIAYAQEFAVATDGNYHDGLNEGDPDSLADVIASSDGSSGVKYTLSGGVEGTAAIVCTSPDFYLLKATSSSGKTFYRSSESGKTSSDINEITIDPCLAAELPGFIEPANPGGGNPPANTVCFNFDGQPIAAYEDGYVAALSGGSANTPNSWTGCEYQYESGYAAAMSGGQFSGVFQTGTDSNCVNFDYYRSGAGATGDEYDPGIYTAYNAGYSAGENGAPATVSYAYYMVTFGSECDADWQAGYDAVTGG
jgi:hypothetical protein